MRGAVAITIGVLIVSAGCVPALKEPPSLEQLAGGSVSLSADEVGEYRERAEDKFASRRVPAVREAAKLWTQVAQAEPDDLDDLISALRARIWLSENEPKSHVRETESTAAVQIGQWCRRRAPDDARCAYWLGAALGVQARERRRTAMDALPRIQELFEQCAQADPSIDNAGPDRALALLFLRAPSWPAGPGDATLGMKHARRAVELRPDFAPNELALGEAALALHRFEDAEQAYERALKLAEQAERDDVPDASEWARRARDGVNTVNRNRARDSTAP